LNEHDQRCGTADQQNVIRRFLEPVLHGRPFGRPRDKKVLLPRPRLAQATRKGEPRAARASHRGGRASRRTNRRCEPVCGRFRPTPSRRCEDAVHRATDGPGQRGVVELLPVLPQEGALFVGPGSELHSRPGKRPPAADGGGGG
jgi:hypothetical protein